MLSSQAEIDYHKDAIKEILPNPTLGTMEESDSKKIEICKIHATLALVSALELIYEKMV